MKSSSASRENRRPRRRHLRPPVGLAARTAQRRLGATVLAEQTRPVAPDADTATPGRKASPGSASTGCVEQGDLAIARSGVNSCAGLPIWKSPEIGRIFSDAGRSSPLVGGEWLDRRTPHWLDRPPSGGAVPDGQTSLAQMSATTLGRARCVDSVEPAQAGSTSRRRRISPRRPARRVPIDYGAEQGPTLRSACRNCSASPGIRPLPAAACRS